MPAIISGESGGKSGKLHSNTVSCGVYRERIAFVMVLGS